MWNFLELKLRWLLRWALAPEFHYATPGTRHMASHYLIGWAYPTVKPQDQSVFWKTSFEDVRRCSLQETNTSLYNWRSWLKSSFWLVFHLEASSSSYLLTNERRLSEHVLVLMFLHNHQGTVYSITNPRKRFSPMLSELVTSTILNSALEALKSPTVFEPVAISRFVSNNFNVHISRCQRTNTLREKVSRIYLHVRLDFWEMREWKRVERVSCQGSAKSVEKETMGRVWNGCMQRSRRTRDIG